MDEKNEELELSQERVDKEAIRIFSLPPESRETRKKVLAMLCLDMLSARSDSMRKAIPCPDRFAENETLDKNPTITYNKDEKKKMKFDSIAYAESFDYCFRNFSPNKGKSFSHFFSKTFKLRMESARKKEWFFEKGGTVPGGTKDLAGEAGRTGVYYIYDPGVENELENKLQDGYENSEKIVDVILRVMKSATSTQRTYFEWFNIALWLKYMIAKLREILNQDKLSYVLREKLTELTDSMIAELEKVQKAAVSKQRKRYLSAMYDAGKESGLGRGRIPL